MAKIPELSWLNGQNWSILTIDHGQILGCHGHNQFFHHCPWGELQGVMVLVSTLPSPPPSPINTICLSVSRRNLRRGWWQIVWAAVCILLNPSRDLQIAALNKPVLEKCSKNIYPCNPLWLTHLNDQETVIEA